MTFSIPCPTDGAVEVGLEDIESIVVRDEDNVEVLFTCPRCGGRISISAQVPHVLLSALEDVWSPMDEDEAAERTLRFSAVVTEVCDEPAGSLDASPEERERIERYCEYFRRQLADAVDVDAVLAEIDGT